MTSILVLTIMAASLALPGEVYAERTMWVWGMAKDIVLDTTARGEFFDFCAAPHGNATKAITRVFFDARPHGFNLMTYNGGADLRNFLTGAHSRGINVEFLSGSKLWAVPEHSADGEALIDDVLAFNLGGNANQRFDGIQYDVEPYLLDSKRKNDPLDWAYDKGLIWATYLTLLDNCRGKVDVYNTANNPDIRFGAAIPHWYVMDSTPGPQEVIDRVDYVAIMDYRDTYTRIRDGAQDEITYAASKGKKVYVGVETTHPTDIIEFPPNTTFYEEGNSEMEAILTQVNSAFSSYSSYAGIAIHYYEDLTGPKGKEISYRSLSAGTRSYHEPVVGVISPNRAGEIWYKGSSAGYIQWAASDLDGGALTIKIEYSADGGGSWGSIINSTSNSGTYLWNTLSRAVGSNYLIRVTATDNTGRAWYDVSDNTFSISNTVTKKNITDLHLWNEGSTSLRLKWTPPTHTPRLYRILRSRDGETSTETVITVDKYIDTGLSGTSKYKYQIWAVYGDGSMGNASNSSNMLIPGDTFLVDYCEENEGIIYEGPWGAGLTYSFDTTIKKEGNKSLKLVYVPSGGWGGILIGRLPAKVDVSPYSSIKFWFRSSVVGRTFKFQLRELGAPDGVDEVWELKRGIQVADTAWHEYTIDITKEGADGFQRVEGLGNNRIDKHTLGGYGLVFPSSISTQGTYYIDEMRLLKGEAFISLPQEEYTFEPVPLEGSIGNHRFVLGPIPVSFGGFSSPWTVRIWTNNGTGADDAGLVGVTDSTQVIPLKVWCINYGPTASVPDEENDYFYGGYDFGDGVNIGRQYRDGDKEDVYTSGTFDENYWGFDINGDGALGTFNASSFSVYEGGYWYRIPEDDEMDPSNKFTWRRLCWAPGAELSSPFDIYLAIDVMGKKNQSYATTTLTVEYINE